MKRILTVLLALLLVFTSGVFSLSVIGLPARVAEDIVPDENLVLANRFANMLNINNVYGAEFESVSEILKGCELSLLNKSNNGKIANSELIGFAKDMYGIDAAVFADEGKEPLNAEAYTEILPRGYGIYTHKVEEIRENEDGTYTVYSCVTAENHDGFVKAYEAISGFAKAENSRFGYILLSCELIEVTDEAEPLIL
ncbi:MAG: hypothetical protein E7568_03140 [Ruminococcaceae bacterium]|nr:hypothetical protein [Oscillospiraceae bacterium]